MKMFCIVFVLLCIYEGINGHGRLVNPPSRASMWRYGFNTPPDYNDNQGFCGGSNVQHTQNEGKCGICGDDYNAAIKEHETPGRYATGQIVKKYQSGDTIQVFVEITANHKGYFIFKLCANNDVDKDPTQDCFDETSLTSPSGSDKFYIDYTTGIKQFYVVLPQHLDCTQCILQWTYITGNSWGVSPNGTGCVGCGPQENFRACSDIAISDGDNDVKVPEAKASTVRAPATSPTSSVSSSATSASTTLTAKTTPTPKTTAKTTPTPKTTPLPKSTTRSIKQHPITSNILSNQPCHGVGVFKNNIIYDRWCRSNCARGFCPASYCSCDDDGGDLFAVCRSHGIYKSTGNDLWCRTNCQLGYCPASHCTCV